MAKQSTVLLNIHATTYEGMARQMIGALGLRKKEPLTKTAAELVEEKRKGEMQDKRISQTRQGRGDTGNQVFGKDGLANVEIKTMVDDLIKEGYVLVAAFYQKVPIRDRKNGAFITKEMRDSEYKHKFVMRFIFSSEPREEPLPDKALNRLRSFLANKSFRYCHVWQNDYSDTINLAGGHDPNCGTYKVLRLDRFGDYGFDIERRKSGPSRLRL